MKTALALLLVALGCGCDYQSQGPWQHTGTVKILNGGGIWRFDLEKPDGTTMLADLCNESANPAWKTGMEIDVEYRVVNPYHTWKEECWEVNSYKIIADGVR